MIHVIVYGVDNCSRCTNLTHKIAEMIQEDGIDADVRKVTDLSEMLAQGITSIPAVTIDGKLMVAGRVPVTTELKLWLGVARGL